ncbi:MAG: D-alanyl-D-alanine carboxypeptidase/D-alanyl-D-alanine-endopeptidase [Gemmatimonadales bacterium]
MTVRSRLLLVAMLAASAPLPAQSLTKRLDARLDGPGLDRLLWGVAVTDLDGHLLYGRNADRLFIPASNTKLVVATVAAALFDPGFTVATSLYGTGPVIDGVLQGDLVLYGRGDPTFSRRCYDVDESVAGVCDTDPAAKMVELARQLRARGVRSIAGDLVGDGSYFEPTVVHPSWEGYDLNWWYAAPVSGLGFNDNSVDFRITAGDTVGIPPRVTMSPEIGVGRLELRAETGPKGSRSTFDILRSEDGGGWIASGAIPAGAAARTENAAVVDANRFAALALRRELAAEGIIVRGATRSTTDSLSYRHARSAPALAEVRSRPVSDWIFPILNSSQNWFAEMLLKQVGKQFGNAGSWEEGRRVTRRFLIDSMKVDSTEIAVEDGSGLAANNLIAPRAFTTMLSYIRKHPRYEVIASALPQSGAAGSLRRRFIGTPLEGRVRAKSGTISRVNTLSGFVERSDGRVLVFSIQANHHTLGSTRMIAAIDSIVVELGKPLGK